MISLIIPCYNEEESIPYFIKEINKVIDLMKKEKFELIFVDDGSKDKTLEILEKLADEDKKVKYISFSRNFGKEAAMFAGLKEARGKYVAIMDADLQHTPEMLILMYKKLINDDSFDCCCAYKSNREDEGSLKRTLTSLFYKINNKISDVKLLPGASDFRVFKKSVCDAITSLDEKTRFLKGMFSWVGFNTIYVPYMPEKRMYGTSKWSLFKLLKYSLGGIISFSTKPIKSVFIIGVLALIVGLLNFILMGNLANRTIILFISFIMLQLGIISLYVSRIYSNILNRPCYIIKEKLGFNDKNSK